MGDVEGDVIGCRGRVGVSVPRVVAEGIVVELESYAVTQTIIVINVSTIELCIHRVHGKIHIVTNFASTVFFIRSEFDQERFSENHIAILCYAQKMIQF